MSEARWQAHKRVVEAEGWRRLMVRHLEDGTTPSCVYEGRRVRVLQTQDHPIAGPRVQLHDGACGFWVPRSLTSDHRGEAPVSVVPRDVVKRLKADL